METNNGVPPTSNNDNQDPSRTITATETHTTATATTQSSTTTPTRLIWMSQSPPSQQPRPTVLSVGTLRRSSPHTTPTRTLQLSELEVAVVSPGTLPVGNDVTLLQQRPRSNQRNRTPRRNESPLDPDEFRRRLDVRNSLADGAGARDNPHQPGGRMLRLGAAGLVGSVLLSTRVSS